MATHNGHSDIGEYGLAEGCERCVEIAGDPFRHGDETLLRRLMRDATAVPRDFSGTEPQLIATKHVLDTLERAGRIAEVAPEALAEYLERWGVIATIHKATT